MINILSEYHAKNKDEKSEHAKGKESGKDAPHGTDEEKHHRQNCQHGQPTAQANHYTTDKGTHETYCHIDHETDRQPLHQIFNAGWSGAEASFQILLYFSSLFHNIDFFFMPCRWLHLARFRGQIRTGRKYARLLVRIFQPPGWTD
ncbi:hypothetical protein BXY_39200 [Bacteroides xylanisolvens XB1A]|uniref:Uncharacterized protein n=1 Tax=Bacteroides xylanisolvens XB1A TaxID=657309 RepID=D6D359_9BACE|nr:hypothetical protein BXY_39200 [Bacteroides xylanisolvens XB1A]